MSSNKPVFILTAPSTAGKNHVLGLLKDTGLFDEMVTMTTRRPRSGEQNGIDYHFATHQEFEDKLVNDEFIEFVKVPGKDTELGYNYYGTPKSSIQEVFERGKYPIVILEPEGAIGLFNYLVETDYLPTCVYLNASLPVGVRRFAERIINDLNEVKGDIESEQKIALSYSQRIEAFRKEIDWIKSSDFDVTIGPSVTEQDEKDIINFFETALELVHCNGYFPWEQSTEKKSLNSQFLVRDVDQEMISALSDLILRFGKVEVGSANTLSKAIRNELEYNKLLKNEC